MNDTPVQALPPGVTDAGRIDEYRGWNDRPLRYRMVRADSPRWSLTYLHGIESHSTWFLPAAQRLAQHGCTTYLLDRRGSGLNREPDPGDAASAEALIADVLRFRQHRADEPMHLTALSWGGKLALATALQQPQQWQSLTLITPGLCPAVNLSLRHKVAAAINLLVGGRAAFPTPIRPEMFTSTPEYLDFIRNDPWRLKRVTARFLRTTFALDRRNARRDARLTLPVLLLLAERDVIIDNAEVEGLVRRVQPEVNVILFGKAEHAVIFDRVDDIVDHILNHLRSAAPQRSESPAAAAASAA